MLLVRFFIAFIGFVYIKISRGGAVCQGGILNDNYCDCLDGSDENTTSACSHLSAAFRCSIKGIHQISLPTSRIQDGICDCCDGSDEQGSLFRTECLNTCSALLQNQRKEALTMYRNIQSGLRAKANLLSKFKATTNSYQQKHDALVAEHKELSLFFTNMGYYLQKEQSYETSLRWILIRQREHACANGEEKYCHSFFNPNYMDDNELSSYGFQAGMKRDSEFKRFVYAHSKKEIDYVHNQKGLRKVHSTLCYNHALLPDEDLRIFTTVGDYMNFQSSPGGKKHRENLIKRSKKGNNFFNRYLEDDQGFKLFYITIFEVMGLIFSPLSGLMYAGSKLCNTSSRSIYSAIELINTHYHKHSMLDDEQVLNIQNWSKLYDLVGFITQIVVDWDNEKSLVHRRFVSYLYSDYNPLYSLSQYVSAYLYSFSYASAIMYYSPSIYYQYHVENKANLLPQRRTCCLLRQGIEYAREELNRLEKSIETYKELHSARISSRDNVNKVNSKDGKEIDYGLFSEYESLQDVCVHKGYQNYNYTLCFFKDIKQEKINDDDESSGSSRKAKEEYSLGKFQQWNVRSNKEDKYYHVLNIFRNIQTHHIHQNKRNKKMVNAFALSTYITLWQEFVESLTYIPFLILGKLVLPAFTEDDLLWTRSVLPFNSSVFTYYDRALEAIILYNNTIQTKDALLHPSQSNQTSSIVVDIQQRLQAEMTAYYSKQYYADGTACVTSHEKVYRSTEVLISCGSEHGISAIEEIEVCKYRMSVMSPLACTEYMERESLNQLDELGVFGFTSNPTKKT